MVLWPLARRHMPRRAVRRQGGGTQRADDEATFAAIVYVLVSGVPWRALPKTFAVSWQNTHRRFTQWSEAGLWERIQHTSRAAQAPAAARQWADRMRALAEGRLSRPGGPAARAYTPEPGIRSVPADPLPRPPRARIRVHEPDGFTDRLFGVGLPARAAPRTAGDERAAS
jgi:transposase